ncbi:uncharacterized protein [Anabrus simplex]|uniref:uncharacterized protein n=1 Tax=Anabrus simplex TaxID=316456 RepID=UPI0035A37A4E
MMEQLKNYKPGGPDGRIPGSLLPLTQAFVTLQDHRSISPDDLRLAYPQKTRYSADEELPPPPSPPQLKEVSSLDGVPRPTSAERILVDSASQHVILRDGLQIPQLE